MNTQKILVKKLHPNAKIPIRSTELSGGWDIFCTEVIQEADDFIICKTGLSMMPFDPNYKITLVPRSSLTKTKWVLQNSPGLGDPDYTGEYQYRFRALPLQIRADSELSWGHYIVYPECPFISGDRIGQIYLEEIVPTEFVEVEEMPKTKRGDGGFGSTGK